VDGTLFAAVLRVTQRWNFGFSILDFGLTDSVLAVLERYGMKSEPTRQVVG
jgi:hypothetical protein